MGERTFGFASRYLKGTTTPSGNLQFQYSYEKISLKRTAIQRSAVSNNSAIFEGTATINGTDVYAHRVNATDGDMTAGKPDHFKITIWQGENVDAHL